MARQQRCVELVGGRQHVGDEILQRLGEVFELGVFLLKSRLRNQPADHERQHVDGGVLERVDIGVLDRVNDVS